jgi:hypothetical protein
MERTCFQVKGSNPPLCEAHGAPLVPGKVQIDQNYFDLGTITCYVCPVSRRVVADPEPWMPGSNTHPPRDTNRRIQGNSGPGAMDCRPSSDQHWSQSPKPTTIMLCAG